MQRAGPVPQMDLGALTRRVHEEVAVARQRISREPLTHERAEPVEAFAQVGRRAVRPDGDLSRGADHPSARSTATSVSGSSPSTRMPSGVMSTGPATARALWRGASGPTSTARMTAADGFRSHRASVHGATPISRAIAGTFAPAARRRRAIAVTCWRSALGYRTAVGGRPCRRREISARILRTRSSMLAPPFIVGVSMPREAGQRLDGETRGVTLHPGEDSPMRLHIDQSPRAGDLDMLTGVAIGVAPRTPTACRGRNYSGGLNASSPLMMLKKPLTTSAPMMSQERQRWAPSTIHTTGLALRRVAESGGCLGGDRAPQHRRVSGAR